MTADMTELHLFILLNTLTDRRTKTITTTMDRLRPTADMTELHVFVLLNILTDRRIKTKTITANTDGSRLIMMYLSLIHI